MSAFGKDPKVLSRVTSLTRQMEHAATRPRQAPAGGGGRGSGRFHNTYRPSTTTTDTIRILPGKYVNKQVDDLGQLEEIVRGFYSVVEHYDAHSEMSTICSAGPRHNSKAHRDPCLGCDRFWAEVAANKGDRNARRSMSKRDLYVFNVLHYAQYYEVPQLDKKTKQVRLKDDGKTPWTMWVCGNNISAEDKARAIGQKDAHLCHWAVGHGHFQVLMSTNRDIESMCSNCGAREDQAHGPAIRTEEWVCGNPDCHAPLIDVSTTNLSPEDLQRTVNNPMVCRACKQSNFPEEVISCVQCAENAVRASLYDVDLRVKRVQTGGAGSKQTQLVISNWSSPAPLDPKYQNLADRLYDLPAIYAPTPLEVQAKLFEMPLPEGYVPAGLLQGRPAV